MSMTADQLSTELPGSTAQAELSESELSDRFVDAALTANKREGLILAVRARWVALAVIAVLLPIINPRWEALYYEALLMCFALIGYLQLKIGRVGVSRSELLLMFCDLALMTLALVVPNPFAAESWPMALQYKFGNFMYFFVLLASATLAYSWRTLVAMGTWTTALWALGLGWIWLQPLEFPELSAAVYTAIGGSDRWFEVLDPNGLQIDLRIQEVVIFLIVACTLAIGSRRSKRLLTQHAATERERTNLARYFSPNVVEELSQNDEPLKQTRTQNVAVLFVDIVGFTEMAEARTPQQVIQTLREFHGRMEREVFGHNGTLDKYLGDGLMATFGTPSISDDDAGNALRCARAMIEAVADWNRERAGGGAPAIKASFGLHYGEAVLGNIGANRLEFAVIGNTVNVASRLETLTRALGVTLVASDVLMERARGEPGCGNGDFDDMVATPPQPIRGVAEPIDVWTFSGRSTKR
jgi:adenylate cyclase